MSFLKTNLFVTKKPDLLEGENIGTIGNASVARDIIVCALTAMAVIILSSIVSIIRSLLNMLGLSGGIVVFPIVLLSVVTVLYGSISILKHRKNYIYITDIRVISGTGKKVLCSDLSDIKNVSLEKGLGGQIFNYGSINIVTKTDSIYVEKIDNADVIYRVLMDHAEQN